MKSLPCVKGAYKKRTANSRCASLFVKFCLIFNELSLLNRDGYTLAVDVPFLRELEGRVEQYH